MEIGKKMNDALNAQIKKEIDSAYIYLGMAAYFDAKNLKGFAHWMKKQAGEEMKHAMRIYDFVNERSGSVQLFALDKPSIGFKSPAEALGAAYTHEQFISSEIHKLVDLAAKEDDKATSTFLQWFVNEQVEEESQTRIIIDQLKMIGDSKGALFQLDHVLGTRQ